MRVRWNYAPLSPLWDVELTQLEQSIRLLEAQLAEADAETANSIRNLSARHPDLDGYLVSIMLLECYRHDEDCFCSLSVRISTVEVDSWTAEADQAKAVDLVQKLQKEEVDLMYVAVFFFCYC